MPDPTTLREAVTNLKGKRVTATTAAAAGENTAVGTLKMIGNDFIDIEWTSTKSTIIPLAQLVALKEE